MSEVEKSRGLLAEIAQERARGLMIRRVVAVAVLGAFGLFAANIYSKINSFEEEVMLTHLQEQVATRIWPMVTKELDSLSRKAVPALSSAFEKEAIALLPKLNDKLVTESEVFQNNLNRDMKTSLDNAFLAAMEGKDAEIRAKLPAISQDSALYDDLMRRLQKSSQDWSQEQLDTVFLKHLEVLQSINETVNTLQKEAAAKGAEGGEQTVDDVLLLFTEIINARLDGEE